MLENEFFDKNSIQSINFRYSVSMQEIRRGHSIRKIARSAPFIEQITISCIGQVPGSCLSWSFFEIAAGLSFRAALLDEQNKQKQN